MADGSEAAVFDFVPASDAPPFLSSNCYRSLDKSAKLTCLTGEGGWNRTADCPQRHGTARGRNDAYLGRHDCRRNRRGDWRISEHCCLALPLRARKTSRTARRSNRKKGTKSTMNERQQLELENYLGEFHPRAPKSLPS